jgi:uncharacterized protein (TIGR02284 family)
MKTKEIVSVLNDLIRINNDRSEGYEKAAQEVQDTFHAEIKTMFYQFAEESRRYKEDLVLAVRQLGGDPAESTTASGKLYRAWMDVKVAFAGDDVKATLESCEFGEDAALKAYKEALESETSWPADIAALVANQRQLIRASHDRVKRYRDEFKTVDTH